MNQFLPCKTGRYILKQIHTGVRYRKKILCILLRRFRVMLAMGMVFVIIADFVYHVLADGIEKMEV